jgi:hypothetical protein
MDRESKHARTIPGKPRTSTSTKLIDTPAALSQRTTYEYQAPSQGAEHIHVRLTVSFLILIINFLLTFKVPLSLPPTPFFGTHRILYSSHTHTQTREPPGFYQGSALDTDRDGLSRQAAPTEGRGDGACAASVVPADLIFNFISG